MERATAEHFGTRRKLWQVTQIVSLQQARKDFPVGGAVQASQWIILFVASFEGVLLIETSGFTPSIGEVKTPFLLLTGKEAKS